MTQHPFKVSRSHFVLAGLAGILLLLLFMPAHAAANIKLKRGHPTHYTVKPGDTLWGISAKFLADPLQWPELIQANPQLTNPGSIYPGQVLELHVSDGVPKLYIIPGGTVKLSPKVQSVPVSNAIETIPLAVIRPFLNDSRVIGKDELKNAPAIIAQAEEHFASGVGGRIYVQGIPLDTLNTMFAILRPGRPYVDPRTAEVLGYAAYDIGKAELVEKGCPAILMVTSSRQEVLIGDKVIPQEEQEYLQDYTPRIPKRPIKGDIIGVLGAATQIGQYQVVAIDRGHREGLAVGDILAVYHLGKTIPNPHAFYDNETIKLPNERSGVLMIFRVFPKVSYGLIMYATQPIHLLDIVQSPNLPANICKEGLEGEGEFGAKASLFCSKPSKPLRKKVDNMGGMG